MRTRLFSGALLVIIICGFSLYGAASNCRSSDRMTAPSAIMQNRTGEQNNRSIVILPIDDNIPYENEEPFVNEIYDELFSESDSAAIPKGELRIASTDLSKSPAAGQIYIKNNTNYQVNASDYITIDSSAPITQNIASPISEPKVLIYHSHGTEGYAEDGKLSYAKKDLPRTKDITKNVVAVGEVIAKTLNDAGIPTLHCKTMHDDVSYINAYSLSRQTINEYLEKYPSIEYIFDVHRDALQNSTTTYKTLTYDESDPVAQVMLVVGTGQKYNNHPTWQNNFAFAVNIQYLLTLRLNSIVRPICLKSTAYNQELMDGALLLEVGTVANTLSEAKRTAAIVGQSLATAIRADLANNG